AFRSATVRSFEHWKNQFMNYTYNQLSCTSAENVHSWTMKQVSEDSVVDLLAQFNYKQLADVIVEHHDHFVHKANDAYFQYLYQWKYSLEYEYHKYKQISEGKADINHFLNYLDDDSTATFIDTLDAFRILRNNTAQQINESLEADEWDEYFDQYKEKRSSLVEQQFIRQFSIQNLEGDPLLQYKYRKVLDEPGNKIYLFLPSANYALHSVLGIFTRQPDNTWKYELDQLEFNAEADGEQDFTPFNNAFGILGKSNCLVLDTAGTGVQLHKLFVSYEYFSRYPFIWIVGDAQDDLPHGFALNPYHNEIFYHMLDSTEIVGMKFTKEIDVEKKLPTNGSYYDDSYYYNRTYDYNLERTEAQRRMKTDALTTQNLQKLAPWRILYHQPFATADLDGDGITELFTYDISAGKVERQQCYTMRSGALTRLPDEEAKTLLANSQRFQNLMHYSAMGNKKK
ncbi:MAG: hypothetical protein ACKVOR_11025, partial [Flavobacteriales bacterium]